MAPHTDRSPLRPVRVALAALLGAAATVVGSPVVASAEAGDPFYTYGGDRPLAAMAPGRVLDTRTMPYHVAGLPTPVTAVQILYRTSDVRGRATANVTTVLRTPTSSPARAVSYQSFYDSMNPEDAPSRAVAGDVSLGGLIPNAEALFIAPLLASGYTVVVPDTEGPSAHFAAGPEYGTTTLDSIRAATRAPSARLRKRSRFAMVGYSGGAIATNWAAQLAPRYAPGVNARLVGAAEGGVLVDPAHNLRYVDGSGVWAGVIPMALAGVARAYGVDPTRYLNAHGRQVFAQMEKASIANVLGQYPGLTWAELAKPRYADPFDIPVFVRLFNKLNMGSAPTPTVPMYIAQGAAGWQEGSRGDKRGIGPGDGVMIAGDVRTLARQYCADGNRDISYDQYEQTSHQSTTALWGPLALGWLSDRFAGKAAPSDCGRIAPGNPLTPIPPAR